MLRLAISAVVGIVLGVIGSLYLFVGSALSLIPWSIAGLAIGAFCKDKREALLNGATYGFLLAFAFMVAGYSGSEPIITRIPFFAILGVVGAVCGAVLALAGNLVATKLRAR